MPAPWGIVGAIDFSGDGLSDLLWGDPNTGAVHLWVRQPGEPWKEVGLEGGPGFPELPPPNVWFAVATARLGPDEESGVIFTNFYAPDRYRYARGQVTGTELQLIDAGPLLDPQGLGLNDRGWKIVAVDDFNADGHQDCCA
jgi:hypothetical protein